MRRTRKGKWTATSSRMNKRREKDYRIRRKRKLDKVELKRWPDLNRVICTIDLIYDIIRMRVIGLLDRNPIPIGIVQKHTSVFGSVMGLLALIVILLLGYQKIMSVLNR
jgi:hypothetical protein